MWNEVKAILFGRKIALQLIHDNPGAQIVFTDKGIGECCLELSYLREYQKYNDYSRIVVVSLEKRLAMFKYFQNEYDQLVIISEEEHNILLKFYKSDFGQLFRKKHPEIFFAFGTGYVRHDLLVYHPYLKMSQIQKAICRIPQNTMPCQILDLPQIEWVKELEIKSIIKCHRTIILNPYANTCQGPPFSFWERLAEMFKNLGFKVITSICEHQRAIQGTYGLQFTLDKLIALANECGYVIGVRSGFLDLATFSNAVIASIDEENYPYANVYRLEDCWPQNPHIRSFMYKKENEATLADDIAEYIKEKS